LEGVFLAHTPQTVRVALSLAIFAAVACGPASDLETPGLAPIDAVYQPAAPAMAMPPAAPTLTPCPTGWTLKMGDVNTCEPWPDDSPQTCPSDSAQFPGDSACTRVGTDCPAGNWLDAYPDGGVRFVLPGAAAGGVGTQQSPFATLDQAVAAAQPGDIIALSKGTHTVNVALPAGITVFGACTAQTTVTTLTSTTLQAALWTSSAGVSVRNLRITGPRAALTCDGANATLDVQDVVVDTATAGGLIVLAGSHATARDVVIRKTAPYNGIFGNAIVVQEASTLTLTRAVLDGNANVALQAGDHGTTLTATDLAILDTRPLPDHTMGRGINAQNGATVDVSRAIVQGSRDTGIIALSSSQVTLTDVVVRDTIENQSTHEHGDGLAAQGGQLTGQRVRSTHNANSGVEADQGTLSLTDALIETTTLPTGPNGTGVGAAALRNGTLTLQRAVMRDNIALGAVVVGASIMFTDVTISDTQFMPTPVQGDSGGGALFLQMGSHATLTRTRFTRNASVALLVLDVGSTLNGTDFTIDATQPNPNGLGGIGAIFARGAQATLAGFTLDGNATGGLDVGDTGTVVSVEDLVVTNTASDGTGSYGQGVLVRTGASLSGNRALVSGNHVAGLMVDGTGATASFTGFAAKGTLPCSGTANCPMGSTPSQLAALDSAHVTLSDVLLAGDGASIGVLQASGGQIDLSQGEVSYNAIGADVMDAAYDTSRLSNGIMFRHNGQQLLDQMVPLPTLPPQFFQ
jgi:hypothetical protein